MNPILIKFETTEAYHKRLAFFGSDFRLHSQEHGNLAVSFYEKMDGFQLIEQTNSFAISQKVEKLSKSISEEKVLDEHIYVLQKT